MKKVLLFDPGLGSLNRGDEIISRAVQDSLKEFLADKYVIGVSTHNPLNQTYINLLENYDYRFVCGSNLLMGKQNGKFRQWDISSVTKPAVNNSILVGVGWWQANDYPNAYTKRFYNSILNKEYKHSVRDDYTKKILESMGIFNVINTGCPTMWGLTKEFCEMIPTKKANKVIFTLTDYNKCPEADIKLIETLLDLYEEVYFWLQGVGDFDYLTSLGYDSKVTVIGNTLTSYDEFLSNEKCDYVGTRLHGGIRALQNRRRSIIIAVDNRAREKKKDFNIPCLERSDISSLGDLIVNDFSTEIVIPVEAINEWKGQFV